MEPASRRGNKGIEEEEEEEEEEKGRRRRKKEKKKWSYHSTQS